MTTSTGTSCGSTRTRLLREGKLLVWSECEQALSRGVPYGHAGALPPWPQPPARRSTRGSKITKERKHSRQTRLPMNVYYCLTVLCLGRFAPEARQELRKAGLNRQAEETQASTRFWAYMRGILLKPVSV